MKRRHIPVLKLNLLDQLVEACPGRALKILSALLKRRNAWTLSEEELAFRQVVHQQEGLVNHVVG